MIKVSSDADRIAVAKLQEIGQDHVFAFWDELPPEGQKKFLSQLRGLDLPLLKTVLETYRSELRRNSKDRVYEPVDSRPIRSDVASTDTARADGERALREGKVAVVMSAVTPNCLRGPVGPKGDIPIGPVSGKSLYCLQAEKLLALAKHYRASIPLFIVASDETYAATLETFEQEKFFGLSRQDVRFLHEESLPVINRRGPFLLANRGRLAMSPTGHGAAITQLLKEDNFKQLEVRGIEYIFVFQVENPLVQIADPLFLGRHMEGEYEISSKAVRRTDPDEQLGVFCRCNGASIVVEPDQLADSDQKRRLDDGALAFSSANADIHFLSMAVLRKAVENKLAIPYRFVSKSTRYVDRRGRLVNPKNPNSIVFQTHLYDAISWAKKSQVIETPRDEEFSPVGVSSEDGSSDRARRALSRVYQRWLDRAGAAFPNGGTPPEEDLRVEISPLFARNADELKEKVTIPLEVTSGLYLE